LTNFSFSTILKAFCFLEINEGRVFWNYTFLFALQRREDLPYLPKEQDLIKKRPP
jgi:hypothetical protein